MFMFIKRHKAQNNGNDRVNGDTCLLTLMLKFSRNAPQPPQYINYDSTYYSTLKAYLC